jgi:hypothetical protein
MDSLHIVVAILAILVTLIFGMYRFVPWYVINNPVGGPTAPSVNDRDLEILLNPLQYETSTDYKLSITCFC